MMFGMEMRSTGDQPYGAIDIVGTGLCVPAWIQSASVSAKQSGLTNVDLEVL